MLRTRKWSLLKDNIITETDRQRVYILNGLQKTTSEQTVMVLELTCINCYKLAYTMSDFWTPVNTKDVVNCYVSYSKGLNIFKHAKLVNEIHPGCLLSQSF